MTSTNRQLLQQHKAKHAHLSDRKRELLDELAELDNDIAEEANSIKRLTRLVNNESR